MSDVKPNEGSAGPSRLQREGMELVRFFAGAAAVYLLITTVFFRVFFIPSSSMEPTLEVGDRVMVVNFAYGWSRHSLPFGMGALLPEGDGRLFARMPERGDIVVFRRPGDADGDHLIKRVVGLPGDTIAMRRGRLFINEQIVPQAFDEQYRYRSYEGGVVGVTRYDEALPDGPTHWVYDIIPRSLSDDVEPVIVPEGHVFVMGDNRDQSSDSRVASGLGPIPMEYLVGRAVTVLFTLKRCREEEGLRCPEGRVWRPL